MKADQQPPTPATPPVPLPTTTAPAQPSHHHHDHSDPTIVAQKLKAIAEKAKSGQLASRRAIFITVAVLAVGGALVYLWRTSAKANSAAWLALNDMTAASDFEKFAETNPDSVPSRIAKLQRARVLLGPEGLEFLRQADKRAKGIENVEAARAEFAALAGSFKKDLTLYGQCLDGQAHAELALVGIPDAKDPNKDRGSVDAAAALFREYAKLVGEDTEVGKRVAKQAAELEAKKQEVVQVAKDLHNKLTPVGGGPELKIPDTLTPPSPPAFPIPPVNTGPGPAPTGR